MLTEVLLSTGRPMELTVVVGRPELGERIAGLTPGPGQSLLPVPPTATLPALIAAADLVVSAAGTSTWELCCLGAPSALVCVVDNQRESYHRVVAAGLAAGLGELPALAGELSARAWATVDGRGRERVVDAVLDALRQVAAGSPVQ